MVKINLSNGPEDSGPTIDLGEAIDVFASHSKSSPGSFHVTVALAKPAIFKRFGGEVTIICSCRGFQNHRKCWHKEEMVYRVSEAAPEEE